MVVECSHAMSLTREIQDVETIRSDRHSGLIVFRNRVAKLILTLVPDLDYDADDPPANIVTGLAEDIRIYPVGLLGRSQSNVSHAGVVDGYAQESVTGFRDTGALRTGQEINPGDYTYDPATGTITLNRTDALRALSNGTLLPDDEFTLAWISFRTRTGARPELTVIYGNWTGNGNPFTFNPYRAQVIPSFGVTAGNFHFNTIQSGGVDFAISKPWIKAEQWPLVYQKQYTNVGIFGLTNEAHHYNVNGVTTPGRLVNITAPQDMRMRYKGGWRMVEVLTYAEMKIRYTSAEWTAFVNAAGESGISKGTDIPSWSATIANQPPNVVRFFPASAPVDPELSDQYTTSFGPHLVLTDHAAIVPPDDALIRIWVERYAITEADLLEGPQYLTPRVGNDAIEVRQRLCHFDNISGRQRFEVRAVYYENYLTQHRLPNPTNSPAVLDIVGIPCACHVNETRRLVKAWVAAGKP